MWVHSNSNIPNSKEPGAPTIYLRTMSGNSSPDKKLSQCEDNEQACHLLLTSTPWYQLISWKFLHSVKSCVWHLAGHDFCLLSRTWCLNPQIKQSWQRLEETDQLKQAVMLCEVRSQVEDFLLACSFCFSLQRQSEKWCVGWEGGKRNEKPKAIMICREISMLVYVHPLFLLDRYLIKVINS